MVRSVCHMHMILYSLPVGSLCVNLGMCFSCKLFIKYAFPCFKGMIGHFFFFKWKL